MILAMAFRSSISRQRMGVVAKLVGLDVEETSGVDYPAHLDNGWIVMKATGADVHEALQSTEEKPVPDEQKPEEEVG